jgi:hypothetical protein
LITTKTLPILEIHKLSKAQYEREKAAGRINEDAIYLTPDEEIDLSGYLTKVEAKDTIEKANSAVQSVEAGTGLKAERTENNITLSFDQNVTFIFDCGTSEM